MILQRMGADGAGEYRTAAARIARCGFAALAAVTLSFGVAMPATAQSAPGARPGRPAPRRAGGAGPQARRANAPVNRAEKEALELLRMMLRPQADYSAEETTWIARGGAVSTQTIKGDTRGNVVRHYHTPPALSGDVMLTGPNRYAYFRAATRTLTQMPPEGTEDERDKRFVQGIRQHEFTARVTGYEAVAGINAAIVVVSPVNPAQPGYAKFWIDPATGVRLKVEIANAANAKVSTSELSSVQIGPAASVLPRDFQPALFGGGGAAPREVRREPVASLKEAAARLPFKPLVPGSLPPGYRLERQQIITGPARVGLLVRYTDGVTAFTLTEHRAPAGKHPLAATSVPPRWFIPIDTYDVEVVYRGSLPAAQEQMVHNSLQPIAP
ncbi:MAG TPA: hypothetical protein VKT77_03405 [Chthonomonadaceae bacterium]|nr:hypothetical protein [Chthonomonadaceae bacterium]